MTEGEERHLVIYSSAAKTLNIGTVNSSTTNTLKNVTSISIPAGGFGEINILYINSKFYIRATV